MRRYVAATIAAMLMSLPASGATIFSFEDPIEYQTVTATDQTELLAAILSQVSYVISTAQVYSQVNGFPTSITVVTSQDPPVIVPEPGTKLLSSLGLILLCVWRRRAEVS